MKRTFREKLNYIWEKHKYKIIGILLVGGAVAVAYAKSRNSEEPETGDIPAENETETKPEEKKSSWELEMERKMNAPENQLTGGGWVLEDDPSFDFPMLIANDVPLSSLGTFGEDLMERVKAHGLDKTQYGNISDPRTSIMINLQVQDPEDEKTEEPEEKKEEEEANVQPAA